MAKNNNKQTVNPKTSNDYYKNVPDDLKDTYDWAYVDPKCVKRLDHNFIVWALLFFNAGRLMNRYLEPFSNELWGK